MQGLLLTPENMVENKKDKNLCLHGVYIPMEEQTIKVNVLKNYSDTCFGEKNERRGIKTIGVTREGFLTF